ncbi:VWA domain-containing protein [Xanthobacter sp. AM11]|uniref:VWA domain-containing protein n=1 Tax=Xanthobacter sp. AM11 TaxID=3380643 RepID=UPI0039BFA058
MITLQWPAMLGLIPLPLIVYLLLPRVPERRAGALTLPFFAALAGAGLVAGSRPRRLWGRLAALGAIWLLLVLAAARPVHEGVPVPVAVEGRDVMLAVDLSGSMTQKDMLENGRPTDRIEMLKAVVNRFIAGRAGDRVGLVLFGAAAFLQAPLTLDHDTVRALLDEATPNKRDRGNAIGDAIALGVKALRVRPSEQRVLVLAADGASNSGILRPLLAAEVARNEQVRIHAIGVGPEAPGGTSDGMPGASAPLDEETLKAVAALTGGQYFRARDGAELKAAYAAIGQLEPAAGAPLSFRPVTVLFQWPLGAALVLSLLVAAILLRPRRMPPLEPGEAP